MKRFLPILGCVFFAFAIVMIAIAFFMRSLTVDQRWILKSLFALFTAIMAGCFTGSLRVAHSGLLGFGITAAGGYGAWILTPYLFPAPEGNVQAFVHLAKDDDGNVDGDFTLFYIRSKSTEGSAKGTAGQATITDLPPGTAHLDVTNLQHPRLRIADEKQGNAWRFKIDNDSQVTIHVIDRYLKPDSPKQDMILDHIKTAEISRDEILETVLTPDEKKDVVLTVNNRAGREYTVCLYDCWWCFQQPTPGSLRLSTPLKELRITDSNSKEDFKRFDQLKSTSGYFDLYIDYDQDGASHRQFFKVCNLFRPKRHELTIDITSDTKNPFHIELTPR